MNWFLLISGFFLSFVILQALVSKCRLRIHSVTILFMTASSTLLTQWVFYNFTNFSSLIFIMLQTLFILGVFFAFSMIRFFRDPERNSPKDENIIISPADGIVRYIHKIEKGAVPIVRKKNRHIKIEEIVNSDLIAGQGYLIGIEMSLLDVHVNRSPVNGQILKIIRNKGKFLSLRREDALAENERVTTILDVGEFKLAIVQIASRFVRRIISFCEIGDHVKMGQRIGRITFGSQADIIIPKLPNLTIMAEKGEVVKAGISIIARYGQNNKIK